MKFIHSGSTLLNLTISGKIFGGWLLGKISNIVGDRSSGKTLLAIEAAKLHLTNVPKGETHKVHYIETEAAFDQGYAQSIGLPVEKIDFYQNTSTIEKFFETISEIIKKAETDESHLVILDSLDALTSQAELDNGLDKGSYGMDKQKKLSQMFRMLVSDLDDSNIHLMIISQIRDNISATASWVKDKQSGGRALAFYCSQTIWLKEAGKLKNTKTDRSYGLSIKVENKKNKVSTPYRTAAFPIIFGYGVDDIGSMIDFLINTSLPKELQIVQSTGWYHMDATIAAKEAKKYRKEDLIKQFETTPDMYCDLLNRVARAWEWLEEETAVERAPKEDLYKMASEKLSG